MKWNMLIVIPVLIVHSGVISYLRARNTPIMTLTTGKNAGLDYRGLVGNEYVILMMQFFSLYL